MRINVLKSGFVLLVIAAFYAGCVKNSTTTPPVQNPTVAQLIKSATNLTIFNAALVRSGLDTVLNTDSMVTVFVATDNIMGLSGITIPVVDTLSLPILKTFLEYNIYAGAALQSQSSNFPVGPNAPLIMSSGDSLFVTKNGTAIYINGISVPTTDVTASNGIIDVMAQPLFPPSGTILQIIQADSTLSYFDSAVARTASSTSANIQSILTNGNIFTVLVPNNNAFRNAGYTNVDTFDIINPDTLGKFLSYHIILNRYFTSDMGIAIANTGSNDTVSRATLSGASVKITQGPSDYQAEGNSDSTAANLYAPNIMARNGVVHKIDQVLHP